jgi:ribosomal protein S5
LTSDALSCTQGKIKSLEQIFLFSLPVKEWQIVETFLGTALKDEVMKIMPVQKQTRAGQRTRFKVHHGPLFMSCKYILAIHHV